MAFSKILSISYPFLHPLLSPTFLLLFTFAVSIKQLKIFSITSGKSVSMKDCLHLPWPEDVSQENFLK